LAFVDNPYTLIFTAGRIIGGLVLYNVGYAAASAAAASAIAEMSAEIAKLKENLPSAGRNGPGAGTIDVESHTVKTEPYEPQGLQKAKSGIIDINSGKVKQPTKVA
jgi:hypothetical protein